MHRVANRRLIMGGLLLLLIAWPRPATGDETQNHSTWKIVEASEPTDEFATQPSSPTATTNIVAPVPVPSLPPASSQRSTAMPLITPSRVARPIQPLQPIDPQFDSHTRNALAFYGGATARATMQQFPRRTPVISSPPQPARRQGKPFSTMMRDPTITPYLNLDRDDDNQELPNYFTFVRPQLEQQEANRRHQRDFLQLERQVQNVSTTIASPQYRSAGLPATGHSARFMDTAQYYGRWQR